VTEGEQILRASRTVLVVDWPSRDVPDALARAGLEVVVRGGPGPNDFSAYRLDPEHPGQLVVRPLDAAPEQVDLVYAHRPLVELAAIVDVARALRARAIWVQSGLSSPGVADPQGCWLAPEDSAAARQLVESAGVAYLDSPYIAEAARGRPPGSTPPRE
jgi:predicted CoA-binding protein